jgi:Zinc knuckle
LEEIEDVDENNNPGKVIKCYCCKQLGHLIKDCKLDPNLKTTHNISDDEIRVMSASSTRKMHINSIVSTTHLFKKAVMIPTKGQ